MAEQNPYNVFDNLISSKYFVWAATTIFFVAGLALTFYANGTCDDGDSIMHYQFARWAILHHQLFFDHWAKPLYVLIACPFAQMGLPGIKIFNLAVSAITILLTFFIAGHFGIERKGAIGLFMIMSPGLIVHSLSGLTEPLFALVLVTAVLLYLRNYICMAVLVISFLPFVRSEGLIICGVFALLLIIEKRWRLLPLLLTGHVVYSLAGYHIYHNILWVFTRIPYTKLSSVYGKGNWSHFFINLPGIIGIPLYVLLVIGLAATAIAALRKEEWKNNVRKWVLVYGSFLSYFTGHVIFWKLGIFNSLGLLRVLIGVLPMMALIELDGLNAITQLLKSTAAKRVIVVIALAAILIFPFMRLESSWHYRRDFCLTTSQLADKEATDYLKSNFSRNEGTQYYYDANYVSILLNIDFFDSTISRRVWEAYGHPPRDTAFVFWDNYYSAFECQTPLEVPANNPRFQQVKKFTLFDPWNYEKTTVLFKTREQKL